MTNAIFKRLLYKKRLSKRLYISKKNFDFLIYIIEQLGKNQFFLNKYKNYINYMKKYIIKINK